MSRASELEADLARVTAERDALRGQLAACVNVLRQIEAKARKFSSPWSREIAGMAARIVDESKEADRG